MRSNIAILIFIQDLSVNKTDRKRIIMANVEDDAGLYLSTQRPDHSTDEFYKTFTAQVDIINVKGESAGFHNCVYNKDMLALWDRDLVTVNSLAAMSPAEKMAIKNRLQK